MYYKKLLEIKEDKNRIYFYFFGENNMQNIIGIPKSDSNNQQIYAGTNDKLLYIVDTEKAKYVLTEMMKRTLSNHPALSLCNKEALKLLL